MKNLIKKVLAKLFIREKEQSNVIQLPKNKVKPLHNPHTSSDKKHKLKTEPKTVASEKEIKPTKNISSATEKKNNKRNNNKRKSSKKSNKNNQLTHKKSS